jgi:hypothetical protein
MIKFLDKLQLSYQRFHPGKLSSKPCYFPLPRYLGPMCRVKALGAGFTWIRALLVFVGYWVLIWLSSRLWISFHPILDLFITDNW